jgi:DNA-binding transcriptional ArsR family regulator
VFVLRADAVDLVRCRFLISPLTELSGAVRTTHRPAGQRWHLPWLDAVAAADPPAGLALVQALQPPSGYTPDFLAPPPTASTAVEAEIDGVARTPADRVAHELLLCRADQPDPAVRAVLDRLLEDPAAGRDAIAEALRSCWRVLLAPHWERIRQLLDADIAYRARQLADTGLVGLLAALHPDVRLRDGAVEVRPDRPGVEGERILGGAGLVLLPSAFTWPHALAVLDPPWQPTVVYPARGVGDLWERRGPEPAAALAALVGATRARLLADLAEPAATTVLARHYGMAASTLSRHLAVLRAAGLVAARRDRRQVLYGRTPLGAALAEGGG